MEVDVPLALREALERARRLISEASARAAGAPERVAVDSALAALDRVRSSLGARDAPSSSVPPLSPLEHERLSRVEAEATQRRLAFAYQASNAMFDGPLDVAKRLDRLVTIAVPDLADWCFCDRVLTTHIERAAMTTWNPEHYEKAAELAKVGTEGPRPPSAIDRVIATGTEHVVFDVSPSALAELGAPFEAIGARSVMILPLRAREKVLGAVTFAFTESNRQYSEKDLNMAHDLAQRAEVAIDNALLVSELERSVRARDEMVGIVSHDLRSPVSTVAMASVLLLEGLVEDPAKARPKVAMIARAAKRMEALLGDLLDITTIEAGGLTLDRGQHDARALVSDTLEIFQQAAAQKGIVLSSSIQANVVRLRCDRDRVIQVLSNLISNAIRFTPEKGTITVRMVHSAENRETVVSVSDTGAGIPPDQLQHVFDRFYQGRRKAREGAGLGLSIVRGIVASHGGQVSVSSELGKGTTFSFTLPD